MNDEEQNKINEKSYMEQFTPSTKKPDLPVDDNDLDIGLGTDYSKSEPEPEKKSDIGNKLIIATLVGGVFIVVLVWSSWYTQTGFFEPDEFTTWDKSTCDGILMEGKAIVLRNDGIEDYNLWNSTNDRDKVIQLEDNFLSNCIVDKAVVLKYNLDRCAVNLVNWHTFVDELPSKDKATWDDATFEKDSIYKTEYDRLHCGAIQDYLDVSDQMVKHNEQYHAGGD